MNDAERLSAIEEIRQAKSRYFRGVDTGDGALVRSILAADCELDYVGCCTDPATGRDFFPAMNVVLHGRDAWVADAFAKAGIVSVHQGHNAEITFTGDDSATVIWSMTDRLFLPEGGPYRQMTGYGYYHETYVRRDDEWQIRTLRIVRLRVEAA